MILLLIFLIFSFNRQGPRFTSSQDECQPASCHPSGPIVRFPFRLIGIQPAHCGYPGFDLSCNPNSSLPTDNTEIQFQFPVRASTRNIILPITATATVQEIDYRSQVIRVSVLNGSCLPARVPQVNSTPSPFEMYYEYYQPSDGYTLFNCTGRPKSTYQTGPINCLDHGGYLAFAYNSFYSVADRTLHMCVKMYNVSHIPGAILVGPSEFSADNTQLHWPEPSCGDCEARGGYCRWRRNGANNETDCYEIPREPHEQRGEGLSRNATITVALVSTFVAALASSAALYFFTKRHKKRKQQRRLERILEDYKAHQPTRFTYSDIKHITHGFRHRLGQGGYGTVFKGNLSSKDIPVAVKVLDHGNKNGDFLNEVATIGKIRHVNVVRLVGYCTDGSRAALVYEFLENDSLEKYIPSGGRSRRLGWEKLLGIATGVARGIGYLHEGCNQRILHLDIKPHNILLDRDLNPKVADFGLAKLCSKERSMVTMTGARGTVGYIAPEVFSRNFGRVSYKSDIYSFGMLLLDMVGGRQGGSSNGGSSEIYFPESMYKQLEKRGDIGMEVEREEESSMARRLIIVRLWCIQWYPADRPSAKVVIRMLEGESMPIMAPNPFAASELVGNGPASGSSGSSFGTANTSFMSTS